MKIADLTFIFFELPVPRLVMNNLEVQARENIIETFAREKRGDEANEKFPNVSSTISQFLKVSFRISRNTT